MKSYAQNLEDVLLFRIFKNKKSGFYIDIGAHHPNIMSITKIFYDDLRWNGINIDPIKESIDIFNEERKRDINICSGISDYIGTSKFYVIKGKLENGESASALSTFSHDLALETCKRFNFSHETREIPVTTLEQLCKRYLHPGTHVDFLKIDAEGCEEKILAGMNFDKIRPTILVIETTSPSVNPLQLLDNETWNNNQRLDPLMKKNSYSRVYFDGLNAFYLADEHQYLAKFFLFPVGVFDGLSVPAFYKRISDLCKKDNLNPKKENNF